MATNGISYNPRKLVDYIILVKERMYLFRTVGKQTGPVSGTPPPVSEETKSAISNAAQNVIGSHAPGQDSGKDEGGKKVKSEKELEKERKKAEKKAKFDQKQAKAANAAVGQPPSKNKEKKSKAVEKAEEALPEYIEDTPVGEKKRKFLSRVTISRAAISWQPK